MEKPRPLQLNAFTDANSGVSVTRLRGKLSHGRSHRLDLIHLRLSQRANWSLLCIPVRPHVEPFGFVPAARWLGGSQWHALTYLGSNWGLRDTRHPEIKWADWACAVVAKGGAITFNIAGILSERDYKIFCADHLELSGQNLHIEIFYLGQLASITREKMHEDPVARLWQPIRVVIIWRAEGAPSKRKQGNQRESLIHCNHWFSPPHTNTTYCVILQSGSETCAR